MKSHPWKDVMVTFKDQCEQGNNCYQQFQCEHCRSNQTMATPNIYYENGICEECGETTDLQKAGCNFLVHIVLR